MTCRHNPDLGYRVLSNRHSEDCPGDQCPGCEPCPERHCCVCYRGHCDDTHPQTCPGCVAQVRDHLSAIVDMHERLETEVTHTRNDGRLNTGPMGGDAMVMLAEGRFLGAARQGPEELRGDPLPPLLVLATWEDDWRIELGHQGGPRATIWRAADYLGTHLTMMSQRHLAFDEFAADLARCRARLEDVLSEGERDEVSRVGCIDCGALLVKRYAKRVADDHWVCPRAACKRRYFGDDINRAKHHQLASEEAATWVPLLQAAQTMERSGRTVRTWVNRLQVSACCDRVTHKVYVWWPHVRDLSVEARRRTRPSGEVA